MFNNLKIRTRLVIFFFIVIILPLLLSSFTMTKMFSSHILNASDEYSVKLKKSAEMNLQDLSNKMADEINDFISQAEMDLKIFARVSNNEFKNSEGDYNADDLKSLYWAMSDWDKYADRDKIAAVINGKIENENYNKLKLLLNEDQLKKINLVLMDIVDSKFLSEKDGYVKDEFYYRFLINDEHFFYLKDIADDILLDGKNNFLFLNLMFDLLNEDGKIYLLKMAHVMNLVVDIINLNEDYDNLRLGYWGNSENGFEFIYSGDNKPYHPAFNGIGNSYYCKSRLLFKDRNDLNVVWDEASILKSDEKVSVATFPIYEDFSDPKSRMVGFVEYWINKDTFSKKISNTLFYETGHAVLIDENGIIISNYNNKNIGESFFNSNGEQYKDLKEIIFNQKSGDIVTKELDGKEKYVTYLKIEKTNWRLITITNTDEIMMPAQIEREHANEHVRELLLSSLTFAISLFAIMIFFAVFLSNSILKPINDLNVATKKISNGNLDIELDAKTEDEIGQLAFNFNSMTKKLRDTRGELEKYNKDLKSEVKKRTMELENSKKDLENKLYELEILSKVTTNRELKMIELKNEIKNLRDKQSK